jgi:hypothetical protein
MDDMTQLIQALNEGSRQAANELIELGTPAVEPVCQLLDSPNERIGEVATKILGAIGDTRAVEPLLQVVRNEEKTGSVRWHSSVEALGRIKDRRAVEPLCYYLKLDNKRWAPGAPFSAAEALGQIKDARAAEPLCQMLEGLTINHNHQILQEALQQIGKPAILPLCQELNRGRNALGRTCAAMALGNIVADVGQVDVYILTSLRRALKDKDRSVREWAAISLKQIESLPLVPGEKAGASQLLNQANAPHGAVGSTSGRVRSFLSFLGFACILALTIWNVRALPRRVPTACIVTGDYIGADA